MLHNHKAKCRCSATTRCRGPAAPNRTPTQPVPNHCKTQRWGRQDEPRVAGHDAVYGLWCHRVRARLLRLLQALEAERPQVRSRPMAPRRSLRPPRGKLDGVLGGEREGDSGAGGVGASLASGSRAGSPPGAQPQRSAKLSSTALCAQPGRANVHHCDGQHVADVRTAARPARPPPCPRHSRPLWRSRAAAWLCRGF